MKCSFKSKTFPSEQKKAETNSEPRSEAMYEGMPCLEKTWRTKNLANIGDIMVLTVGININCLVRGSIMTNIMSEPSEMGNFSMKSLDIEFHGLSGIGSCFRSP